MWTIFWNILHVILTLTLWDSSIPDTRRSANYSRRPGQYITKVTLESDEIAEMMTLLRNK